MVPDLSWWNMCCCHCIKDAADSLRTHCFIMLESLIIKMVIRFCLHQVLPIIVRQLCMAIISGYSRQTTHNIYLIFAPPGAGNE